MERNYRLIEKPNSLGGKTTFKQYFLAESTGGKWEEIKKRFSIIALKHEKEFPHPYIEAIDGMLYLVSVEEVSRTLDAEMAKQEIRA